MTFYDSDMEAKNRELTKEARRKRHREVSDMKKILSMPEGRRLMWRMWSKCGIFSNPFNPNSNQSAFNAGMMKIGQDLLVDVNDVDALMFAKIQQEYVSELKSKKQSKQEE